MAWVSDVQNLPNPDPEIKDMKAGDVAWTVPWAYDRGTGNLKNDYTIQAISGGTCTLSVRCITPVSFAPDGAVVDHGQFEIDFKAGQ